MTIDLSEIEAKVKADRKNLLIRICSLIIVNTVLFAIIIKGGRGVKDNFFTALNANLVGFNILGFILGGLFAVFPYKGLDLWKKILKSIITNNFDITDYNDGWTYSNWSI